MVTPKVYSDEVELKSTYLSVSEEIGQTIELPLTVSNVGEVDKKVTKRKWKSKLSQQS